MLKSDEKQANKVQGAPTEAGDVEDLIPELVEMARREPHDDEDCHEDDTCRCENIRKLNAEFKAVQSLMGRGEGGEKKEGGAADLGAPGESNEHGPIERSGLRYEPTGSVAAERSDAPEAQPKGPASNPNPLRNSNDTSGLRVPVPKGAPPTGRAEP